MEEGNLKEDYQNSKKWNSSRSFTPTFATHQLQIKKTLSVLEQE